MRWWGILAAGVAGLVFGAGLVVGGVVRPELVRHAFDLSGPWSPSLYIVMLVGACTYGVAFRLVRRRGRPLFAGALSIPERTRVDAKLIIGATIFGAGWGLAGVCPGAAVVSAGAGSSSGGWMLLWIVAGILLAGARGSIASSCRRG